MAVIAAGGSADTDAPATADAFRRWLSDALAAGPDPMRLLAIAADELRRHLGVDRVGYGEIEPALNIIAVPLDWTDGVATEAGRRPFRHDSAIIRHYRAGKTLIVTDLAVAGFHPAEAAELHAANSRALIGVPLLREGELVGLFTAIQATPRDWTAEEVALIAHTGTRIHAALEQVRAATVAGDSGDLFRTLAENMPGICWLADATGAVFWMNARGLAFHGGLAGGPLGRVHPDDMAAANGWQQALATGTTVAITVRSQSVDGHWHPFLCRAEPVRDAVGVVTRWCGVQLDLPDRQRRDDHADFLRAVDDAIRAENDAARVVPVVVDMLKAHLKVTGAALAEADYIPGATSVRLASPEGDGHAVMPGHVLATMSPTTLATLAQGETITMAGGTDPGASIASDEHSGLAAGDVRSSVSVPLVEAGRLVAVFTVHQDILRSWTGGEIALIEKLAARTWAFRERARFEERLAESEALLAAFMEHAPVGMHLKDGAGRYLRVNPELALAMDLPLDEVIGRHPDDLFPPDVAARVAAMEAQALAGAPASAEFMTLPRERYASLLSIVFPIKGDHLVKTGGFTLDLTDRKSAEAALERSRDALYQSEKLSALGSLLAGVSHELNNPLSIVVAQAVMMERQAKGTELAERAFKIRRAADRCARIVQTFLAMARQKKPERTAVDLSAVADAAIELANYGLRADGVGITRVLATDLPRISADGDQLHQIVTNLIVNAQHAMAQTRTLRWLEVRTALGDEPHTVVLEVSDSGPGIPLDMRRRIFEPFFTTKPQGEGTGMGLSFSQGLAEAHGGRLTLMPSDNGACFRLTLPIDERNPLPRVEPAPARPVPATPRRALIVDDEEEIATSLADFLAIEGFECDVVIGGAAAQRRLAEGGDYDLVISDLRMPDVDGPALFAWIGDQRPDLLARTAFTTGDTLGTAAARFLARAGRPVLEKPFMPDSIRHFLAEAVVE